MPHIPGHDLQLPFNMNQTKRLVIQVGSTSHVDEIHVSPAYESVVGTGKK